MREPEQKHSKNVHLKKNNQRMKVTGHITDTLTKIGHELTIKIDGEHRGTLEETWFYLLVKLRFLAFIFCVG